MQYITSQRFQQRKAGDYGVPLLVVGNIMVGGTGKTPAIQALVRALSARGFRCGVVSRGYGGRAPQYPFAVTAYSLAHESGDEPLLLAQSLQCPVVVDPNRDRAVRYLMAKHPVDLIISDDGLQHYGMGRDFELIMLDGQRGLGNGLLLPAGPLRESASRMQAANWIVAKGRAPEGLAIDAILRLNPMRPVNHEGTVLAQGSRIKVCAGIAHPEAFAAELINQGYLIEHSLFLSDHQAPPASLWQTASDIPWVLTEKDAVKLPTPWPEHCYVSRLQPNLPDDFIEQIINALEEHSNG